VKKNKRKDLTLTLSSQEREHKDLLIKNIYARFLNTFDERKKPKLYKKTEFSIFYKLG
jgi:hypothetical protein